MTTEQLARTRQADHWSAHARVVAGALALVWATLFVLVLVLGARSSTYADLLAGIRGGEVDTVQVVGEPLSEGMTGRAQVQLRWRQGVGVRTTTVTQVSDDGEARAARRQDAARPVLVGDVAAHLPSDVLVTRAPHPTSSATLLGRDVPPMLGWTWLLTLLGTVVLVASGPEPWRATRWAWVWLVAAAPPYGVLAFFLLAGPLPLLRPRPSARRLTGGWALLLALVLHGPAS